MSFKEHLVHCSFNKSSPVLSVLAQFNLLNNLTPNLFKIRVNTIILEIGLSFKFADGSPCPAMLAVCATNLIVLGLISLIIFVKNNGYENPESRQFLPLLEWHLAEAPTTTIIRVV